MSIIKNFLNNILKGQEKKSIQAKSQAAPQKPTNNTNNSFDIEEYRNETNKAIDRFCKKYDLASIDGISKIHIYEGHNPTYGVVGPESTPEAILNKKATEYKKEGNYDLAIACLREANVLYDMSAFSGSQQIISRDYFERLVYMLIEAKRYDEAKNEHNNLDNMYGTRLDELKKLQLRAPDFMEYQESVIEPHIKKEKEREEYYWLLKNFPKLAPGSFNSYRSMKKKNSSGFQKIVEELKKYDIVVDDLYFWK